ncbi:hypothetical protein AVEN_100506-1 [Araneus ventricosus]|uniref:Uncharacterized protein n=1 Tax=Araneus ventricosus TaxID=182803 RepID=A0A4Y2SBJ9_ARAVE|nr:hypothetical protein AVEN_100506-1 [Araneus ventricosus]
MKATTRGSLNVATAIDTEVESSYASRQFSQRYIIRKVNHTTLPISDGENRLLCLFSQVFGGDKIFTVASRNIYSYRTLSLGGKSSHFQSWPRATGYLRQQAALRSPGSPLEIYAPL